MQDTKKNSHGSFDPVWPHEQAWSRERRACHAHSHSSQWIKTSLMQFGISEASQKHQEVPECDLRQ